MGMGGCFGVKCMKLSVVLAVLIGILLFAYSSAVPAPAEPTPNIDATVEARAKQLVAAQATPTPYPTYAQSLRGRHLKDTGGTKKWHTNSKEQTL